MSPRRQLSLEALILSLIVALSGCFISSHIWLSIVQIGCLLFTTYRLSTHFFPSHPFFPQLLLTLGTLLGCQSILQTGSYYAGLPLGIHSDISSQILSLILGYIAAFVTHRPPALSKPSTLSTPNPYLPLNKRLIFVIVPIIVALIGTIVTIWQAKHVATVDAIRTPWSLLPSGTLFAFVIVTSATWLAAWRSRSPQTVWFISSLFFVSVAILTPLVYPLGFGFDGFLHRASEQVLLETGTLAPKPFYYIGQYTFVTWITRTLSLPLMAVDTFLFAAMIVLLTATLAINKKPNSLALAALPLLLPLQPWITTTPQSFAYLIGMIGLFLTWQDEEKKSMFPCLIFAIWSVAIHPLAGLPLGGAILLFLIRRGLEAYPKIKTFGSSFLVLIVATIVPLAFFLNSQRSGAQIKWDFTQLSSVLSWTYLQTFFTWPSLRIVLWPDWAAFVDYLFPFILFALALFGITTPEKRSTIAETNTDGQKTFLKKNELSHQRWIVILGIFVLLVGWVMQQTATFTFLIEYERHDYAQRLIRIGQLLLVPAALTGIIHLWTNSTRQSVLNFYGFLIFLTAWQGARIYHAFPYHDATHIEHGWNVSGADKEAVRWIDQDSQNIPYTVLANQSVSAAAIDEIGFKRYAGDVFFYPLPTGGPLYQIFLRAASPAGTLEDIRQAAELGQSSRVYLILNSYWGQADQIAAQLSKIANHVQEISAGKVRIYRFEVTSSTKR